MNNYGMLKLGLAKILLMLIGYGCSLQGVFEERTTHISENNPTENLISMYRSGNFDLVRLMTKDMNSPLAHEISGRIFLQEGNVLSAISEFQKSIAILELRDDQSSNTRQQINDLMLLKDLLLEIESEE